MSNEKYVAPEMDIIEFGNEDLVCTISNVETTTPGGDLIEGPDYGGGWDGSQPET